MIELTSVVAFVVSDNVSLDVACPSLDVVTSIFVVTMGVADVVATVVVVVVLDVVFSVVDFNKSFFKKRYSRYRIW